MNIVITGASRGIGFSTVKSLAKDKSNRIIVLKRNDKVFLEKVESNADLATADITVYPFDLLNFSAENLRPISQNIDVLINNAGILVNKPFDALEEEVID